VQILDDPDEMVESLSRLLKTLQPDGGYAPLTPTSTLYRASFDRIAVLRCTPTLRRAKWKLGQNRSGTVRRDVVERLRNRNNGSDRLLADEVERWLANEAPA
jgi:predicted FMN-binding regulatory protein PaiB